MARSAPSAAAAFDSGVTSSPADIESHHANATGQGTTLNPGVPSIALVTRIARSLPLTASQSTTRTGSTARFLTRRSSGGSGAGGQKM